MKHSVEKYLEDILLSINDIEIYTKDVVSLINIQQNQMLFDALCRRFAIIVEALYQADKLNPAIEVTDKKKIKGLRHIIVHDYDMVRPTDLWRIIKNNLSVLKTEIETLQNKNP